MSVIRVLLNSLILFLVEVEVSCSEVQEVRIDGNVLIASLKPVREQVTPHVHTIYDSYSNSCAAEKLVTTSVIQTEAFLFYFEQANLFLQQNYNFSLGLWLIDSSEDVDISFRRSTRFIQSQNADFCGMNVVGSHSHSLNSTVSLVMGGGNSDIAFLVSKLLSAYCIPFLSLDATCSLFSDLKENPYFLRIAPSDLYQAKALIALLEKLDWNHVGIVYEDTFYGRHLKQDLLQLVNNSKDSISKTRGDLAESGKFLRKDNWTVCVEWTFEIPTGSSSTVDYRNLDEYLADEQSPHVLVVLTSRNRAIELMKHINSTGKSDQLQFIAVDAWGFGSYHKFLKHAIGTTPNYINPSREFSEYIEKVTLKDAKSPWLKALIQQQHNCCWENCSASTNSCSGNETLKKSEITARALTLAAVEETQIKILNETLIRIHSELCEPDDGLCSKMQSMNGSYFMEQLLKNPIFVNGTNSGHPSFSYIYWNETVGTWEEIGSYEEGSSYIKQTLNKSDIVNRLGAHWNHIESQTESCFSDCEGGFPQAGWSGTCCWTCKICKTSENPYGYVNIANQSNAQCALCLAPKVPSENIRECKTGNVHYVGATELIITVPLTFASIGVLVSGICLGIIVSKRFWGTVLIRCAGSGLLVALSLCPMSTYLFLIIAMSIRSQLPGACGTSWSTISTSLALGQAFLLIKANRLHHHCVECSKNIPRFNYSEGCLVGTSTAVQVFFVAVWVVLASPRVIYVADGEKAHLGYKAICSAMSDHLVILLFIFPSFLVLLTAASLFQSYKKVKTHFKMQEHRYLTATVMLTSALYMVVVIPCIVKVEVAYFLNFRWGITALGMIFVAYTNLLPCLHILYLIIFQSHKNTEDYVERGLFSFPRLAAEFMISRKDVDVMQDQEKLGEGYFAEVLLAIWNVNQSQHAGHATRKKTVAVKRLRQCVNVNNQFQQQKFYEEAFVMSQLQHPNVVKFYGLCQTGSRFKDLMVMEYVEGGSLEDFLQKHKSTLTTSDLIGFCKDVANGCAYMEDKQIIHRDLKGSNCLVQLEARNTMVKISDFGLAKDINEDAYYRCCGESVMPAYITAPEGCHGKFTSKSDVWSFGILVWQIFHFGAAPMDRFHERNLAHALENDVENIPRGVLQNMKQCLTREPDSRPNFQQLKDFFDSCRFEELERSAAGTTVAQISTESSNCESNDYLCMSVLSIQQ